MAKIQYASPKIDSPGLLSERPQIPYVAPMFVFMIFMLPSIFGHFAGVPWKDLWKQLLPLVYTAKTLAVALLLWVFWKYYTKIRWTHLPLGVLVGLLGLVEWIGVEYAAQATGLGQPPLPSELYNPLQQLPNPAWRYAFYFIRIAGPTLVVPVMEELFWRDFLMRALIRGARFQEVAVGTFSALSLLGTAALFAAGHFQLAAGFGYGLMMGLLLVRTKSLGSCIVAHATTNLTLGLYILYGINFHPDHIAGYLQFW